MVLEKSYINNILKQILKTTHLEHYDIITEEFESRGKNYGGEIFFVNVKNSSNCERLKLCIKRAYVDEHIRKVLPIRDFYMNENHFYEHIWSKFKTFQEGYVKLLPFDKIPKCYLIISEEDEETIVMEKLSHFKTNDTSILFDKQQLLLIFKEYGKFHALSFAYKEKRPEEYKLLSERLKDNYQHYKNIKIFVDTMNFSHELCNSFLVPGKDDDIINKYEKYVKNAMNIYLTSSQYLGNKSVITHGDCWISNYMFKYDENNKLQDIRFIDFQLSRNGTPVYDLASCIYGCSTEENYSNLEHFLKVYYKSLSDTLQTLDCDSEKVYTFEDLKNEWKVYAKFGFTYAVSLIEDEMVRDRSELADVKNARRNDELRFDEVKLRERMLGLVKHMADNDFL